MTVVLSSHILGEIQLICDSVTIISRAAGSPPGPVAEVLATRTRANSWYGSADPAARPGS